MFSTPRTAEFLERRALQSQTGQVAAKFGDVVIKELLDNALDAAESAGVRPEVGLTVAWRDGLVFVTVTDNGPGMPAEVIDRILDFTCNVSDKESLRSPTRGMQGNAFKTILGIPGALEVTAPVVVEARGLRHELTASRDLAGGVATRHTQTPSARTTGTSVTVPLPAELVAEGTLVTTPRRVKLVTAESAVGWVEKYALANPHARMKVDHAQNQSEQGVGIYEPTAPEGWRKPWPTDPTSAHHYDQAAMAKLVFGHIREHQRGGIDLPLRKFTETFAGLTGSIKAKQVAAALPGITRLSDFTDKPEQIAVLLETMKAHSKPPKPSYLGQISRDHYIHVLDGAFGVEEAWFSRQQLTDHAGIPWSIEVTVARTSRPGSLTFAVNHAATFDDPLAQTALAGDGFTTTGARAFLARCDGAPGYGNQFLRAVVVHLVCPVPQFTDKGKTVLSVPPEVAEACGTALKATTKKLLKDKLSRQKAEGARQRAEDAHHRAELAQIRKAERDFKAATETPAARVPRKMTKKEAVFAVMAQAIAQARGDQGLSFSSHTLYYKIRPLALNLLPSGAKLSAKYVEQTLLPAWEREHGLIQGLYREPRGTLHHPHDPAGARDLRLGTREVKRYIPPSRTFNKILVVEKTGLWPPIHESRIADKYDMAVITTEGYGTEACRDLLARMPAGDVKIFVLHDADPYGYNIARTLGEETARMPHHRVEVIDLGLTVDDAHAKGLESEPDTRDSALPARIVPHLTELAHRWFTGKACDWHENTGDPTRWLYQRVELNAFSSPELIAYIEEGLARHGATGKVIPPADELRDMAVMGLRVRVDAAVTRAVDEMHAKELLADTVLAGLDVDQITNISPDDIAHHLAAHPHRDWPMAVMAHVTDNLHHRPPLYDLARQAITAQQTDNSD
ncbi:DNA topoisomerase VI subunit B [Streptacidiphilus sp. MAP12-20]|uniref:ATP-binding protein n=1 Tax=Streptacidiphilus sp. MAP12-20 TaxID=3156299 RepID=UPI0035118A9D